jgi:hypothetical protein
MEQNWLFLKLQKGAIEDPDAAISQVLVKVEESDLALPFEQFSEIYIQPAFEQLKREQDYLLEQRAADLGKPAPSL